MYVCGYIYKYLCLSSFLHLYLLDIFEFDIFTKSCNWHKLVWSVRQSIEYAKFPKEKSFYQG